MTDLGRTRDPAVLVPGDPSVVRAAAQQVRDRADDAERAGDGLAQIDAGAWSGETADIFHERFGREPAKWFAAASSLSTGADALITYAYTLEWAQGRAAEAIRLWDEAEAASRAAEQVHQAVMPVEPFVDPGISGRQVALEVLRQAVDQVGSAGDAAARFLEQEADAAPEKSSWLDEAGDRARALGADVVNRVASFGNAMIQNPGETATLAGGLLLTAASATGDGLGVTLSGTGAGAVAGVPLTTVSTAGVVAGAGLTAAATASLAHHAMNEDAVAPMSGSPSARSVPTKTDRMKEHLTDRDLDAARRELDGEVVARKPSGQPWDHVDEVRNAQRGLVRRIKELKRLLDDDRVSAEERAVHQSELSEASRLLDHSEQYVPRVVP